MPFHDYITFWDSLYNTIGNHRNLTREDEVRLCQKMHENQEPRLITKRTYIPAEHYLQQHDEGLYHEYENAAGSGSIDEKVRALQRFYQQHHITEAYLAHLVLYLNSDTRTRVPVPVWNDKYFQLLQKRGTVKRKTTYFDSKIMEYLTSNPDVVQRLHHAYMNIYPRAYAAFEEFCVCNQRRVLKQTRNILGRFAYQWSPGDILEFIQIGNTGLMIAVRKFDYKRGNVFSTYVPHWIRTKVERAMQEQLIHVPAYMLEQQRKAKRIRTRIELAEGALSNSDFIAHLVKHCHYTWGEAERAVTRHNSILLFFDHPIPLPDGEDGIHHFIDAFEEENPDSTIEEGIVSALMQESISEQVGLLLSRLSQREEFVIRKRFGIAEPRSYSLDEVGAMLNLTRERIRQIEVNALDRLARMSRIHNLASSF